MPSLQDWLQDVANVWPVVWANKATLTPILVGIVVFEWVILSFWYSGRLARKEAEIRLQDRQLADYWDKLHVSSPADAEARIEASPPEQQRRFETLTIYQGKLNYCMAIKQRGMLHHSARPHSRRPIKQTAHDQTNIRAGPSAVGRPNAPCSRTNRGRGPPFYLRAARLCGALI